MSMRIAIPKNKKKQGNTKRTSTEGNTFATHDCPNSLRTYVMALLNRFLGEYFSTHYSSWRRAGEKKRKKDENFDENLGFRENLEF